MNNLQELYEEFLYEHMDSINARIKSKEEKIAEIVKEESHDTDIVLSIFAFVLYACIALMIWDTLCGIIAIAAGILLLALVINSLSTTNGRVRYRFENEYIYAIIDEYVDYCQDRQASPKFDRTCYVLFADKLKRDYFINRKITGDERFD